MAVFTHFITREPFRRQRVRSAALQIAIVLMHLSFQVNLMRADWPTLYVIVYGALFACSALVVRLVPWKIALLMIMTGVGALTGSPLKYLGLGLGAFLGYAAMGEHERTLRRVLAVTFLVNFVITLLQFFAVSEAVFRFVDYANPEEFIRYSDSRFGVAQFLPQFRPSGIFPSPTYASTFAVMMFVVLASPTSLRTNRTLAGLLLVLMGSFLAVLGSTVGTFLAVAAALTASVRPSLLLLSAGYGVAMIAYASYIPDQFNYNFGMEDFLTSFETRVGQNSTQIGESVLQKNVWRFVVLCSLAVLAMTLVKGFSARMKLIPLGCVLALPVFVHDVTLSMYYWFVTAAACAPLARDGILVGQRAAPRMPGPLPVGPAVAAGAVGSAGAVATGTRQFTSAVPSRHLTSSPRQLMGGQPAARSPQ